jgi:hypothetical protein
MNMPHRIAHLNTTRLHAEAPTGDMAVTVTFRDMGSGWAWVNLTVHDRDGSPREGRPPKDYTMRGVMRMDGADQAETE